MKTSVYRIVLSVVSGGYPNLPRKSPPIAVRRAALDHLFLRLTAPTQGPDRVFLLRRYELVVWPRDRYLNVVDDSTVRVAFTARFPNEFDRQPGTSDIFSSPFSLKGTTNYYLASRIRRIDAKNEERQWVSASCIDDTTIFGRTAPYEIIDHAPNPFALLLPEDSTEIKYRLSPDLERFTRTIASPQDPLSVHRHGTSVRCLPLSSQLEWQERGAQNGAAALTRAGEHACDSAAPLPLGVHS
jgi:hypothetical protein